MSDVKKEICHAVWNGEIDQMSTREVATIFDCSLTVARRYLLEIVNMKSGDERFKPGENELSVLIEDGSSFTYSPMDIDGKGISSNKTPKHYIWFCY